MPYSLHPRPDPPGPLASTPHPPPPPPLPYALCPAPLPYALCPGSLPYALHPCTPSCTPLPYALSWLLLCHRPPPLYFASALSHPALYPIPDVLYLFPPLLPHAILPAPLLQIAAALRAEKLVLMTDVPGVLKDKNDPSTKYAQLNIRDCRLLIEQGIIAGGMIPKVGAGQHGRGKLHQNILLLLYRNPTQLQDS